MVSRCKFSLSVSPQACIYVAAVLLLIPLPWVVAWFVAAAVHELGHCLMVLICGKGIERIEIGGQGAQIFTEPLTDIQTALCAFAGSAGGLSLLFFASSFPRIAVCALLQSAFNLLPVFPLDGGRALCAICRLLFSCKVADKISSYVGNIVIWLFCFIGFVSTVFWKLGILPLAFSLFFLMHMKKIKKLANKSVTGYNSATKIEEVRL